MNFPKSRICVKINREEIVFRIFRMKKKWFSVLIYSLTWKAMTVLPIASGCTTIEWDGRSLARQLVIMSFSFSGAHLIQLPLILEIDSSTCCMFFRCVQKRLTDFFLNMWERMMITIITDSSRLSRSLCVRRWSPSSEFRKQKNTPHSKTDRETCFEGRFAGEYLACFLCRRRLTIFFRWESERETRLQEPRSSLPLTNNTERSADTNWGYEHQHFKDTRCAFNLLFFHGCYRLSGSKQTTRRSERRSESLGGRGKKYPRQPCLRAGPRPQGSRWSGTWWLCYLSWPFVLSGHHLRPIWRTRFWNFSDLISPHPWFGMMSCASCRNPLTNIPTIIACLLLH